MKIIHAISILHYMNGFKLSIENVQWMGNWYV